MTSRMNREEAFSLLVMLQNAQRTMDVMQPLSFVRDLVRTKQQPFVYDVLAFLEECECANYEKQKALVSTAISFINRALQQGKQD